MPFNPNISRLFIFSVVFVATRPVFSQSSSTASRQLLIYVYQGTCYTSSSINLNAAYPFGSYRNISEVPMQSYSIGVSKSRPFLRVLELEYGASWQSLKYKINYDPFDSLSSWGKVLTDQKEFNFLQVNGLVRKNFYSGRKLFISMGAGLSVNYSLVISETTLESIQVPGGGKSLKVFNYRIDNQEQPLNLGYTVFVGLGIKIRKVNEISVRASLQRLFATTYSPYNRSLNALGITLVYAFGMLE